VSIKRTWPNQFESFETGVSLLANDEMVMRSDAQPACDIDDSLRHLDVRARGCGIASRDIVHQPEAPAIVLR
jgi:hypothetical protein